MIAYALKFKNRSILCWTIAQDIAVCWQRLLTACKTKRTKSLPKDSVSTEMLKIKTWSDLAFLAYAHGWQCIEIELIEGRVVE